MQKTNTNTLEGREQTLYLATSYLMDLVSSLVSRSKQKSLNHINTKC